jgi:hypothetical protein
MPDPFPFVYQCRECGAVQLVTRADASEVAEQQRPRFTADDALREVHGWKRARPDSLCSGCGNEAT